LESLLIVQAFLNDNADKLAGIAKTGARQKLDDVIAELSIHAADQQGHNLAAQGATKQTRALRLELLHDHMAPIARIARADLPPTPQIEPLKMPKGKPTVARLAKIADGMAQAAGPFTDAFVSAGLPPDFVARLNGATEALLASVVARARNRGMRKGATTGLKQRLSAARKVVHVLDAFVKTALKDNPTLLADWNSVKRVRRNANRPASVVTPPTPPPTSSTSSTPAAAPAAAPAATAPVAGPASPTPPADAPTT
jgi:hypothetical protein